MEKIRQLKHTLYEVEMKIIQLESLQAGKGLKKNEEAELKILLGKREKLSLQLAETERKK